MKAQITNEKNKSLKNSCSKLEQDGKSSFVKWGTFNSRDPENPDIMEFKVSEIEIFDTEYSTNVEIQRKTDKGWDEVILPLKSHTSKNSLLLKMWNTGVQEKKIKKGAKIKLETWLGVSKNGFPIRRFNLNL